MPMNWGYVNNQVHRPRIFFLTEDASHLLTKLNGMLISFDINDLIIYTEFNLFFDIQ
jgi:hypothetical protein